METIKTKKITFDQYKIKHLEFIQDVIERMIRNSFLLKGWCLTVLFALMTLSKGSPEYSKLIFYSVVLSFYLLDMYFLYQEELFIDLYNYVRKKDGTTFSLRVKYTPKAFLSAVLSFPNTFFYAFLVGVIYIIHF